MTDLIGVVSHADTHYWQRRLSNMDARAKTAFVRFYGTGRRGLQDFCREVGVPHGMRREKRRARKRRGKDD